MSNLKSIFLKITLISAICLLASFSFVIANKKTNTKPQLNATPQSVETVSVQNQKEDNALVLNWTKETPQPTTEEFSQNNNVQMLGKDPAGSSINTTYYTFDNTNFPNLIYGGATITWGTSSTTINEVDYYTTGTISIDNPSSYADGNTTFTASGGYEIVGFMFGCKDSSGNITYSHYVLSSGFTVDDVKNHTNTEDLTLISEDSITPETLDPDYNGTIVFTALVTEIQYTMKYYYRYDNGDYKEATFDGTYTVKSESLDFGTFSATDKPADLNFGRWVFNKDVLENYTITPISDSKFTVSGTGLNLTFFGAQQNLYNNNLIYVTGVKGYGILPQSSGYEVITVKWSKLYDLTITNTGKTNDTKTTQYWKTIIDDADASTYNELCGVNTNFDNSLASDANIQQATLKILDNDDYQYKFMKSESDDASNGFSFKKRDEADDNKVLTDNGWYYVYNYGFYITGYKLTYKETDGTVRYIDLDGTSWKSSYDNPELTSNTIIEIDTLSNETFANLSKFAELVDEISGTDIIQTLTMEPIWAPVNLDIKYNNSSIMLTENGDGQSLTKKYASDYLLDTVFSSEGKSLLCYQKDENLIALEGRWNYTNIPYGKFEYSNTTGNVGEGTYSLAVETVELDNLYRVDLKDDANSINKFKNDSNIVLNSSITDYSFTTSNLSASSIDYSNYMFVYDKFGETSTFMGYTDFEKEYAIYSNTIVDEYSNYLSLFKTSYENSIINGTNNCLRKVYYSGGGTVEGTSILSDPSDKVSALWIYLADGQLYGNLPVFTTADEQQLIMWHNAHNNATETSKHYVYLTSAYNEAEHEEEIYNEDGTLKDNYLIRIDGKWFTSDGNANIHCLKAHFYRKNYLLNVNTVYNKLGVGLYGYVIVSIDDIYNLKEGNFLVADTNNDKTMEIYDIGTYQEGQIKNLLTTKDEDHTLIVTKGDKKYIQLFADCAVSFEVYDQSNAYDSFAGTTAFDNMIGYRYSGLTQIASKKGELTLFSSLNYEDVVGADAIKDLDLSNGEIITLDFNFEPIKYELTIKVGNTTQSEFDLKYNGTVTRGYKEYTINNLTVDSQAKYEILTHIFAGYKLQEEAFTLDNGKTLQKYVDGGDYIQDYSLKKDKSYFYGDWLKTYLYINDSDWTVDATQNLGTITINTGVIDFNFSLKLYDSYSEEILNPKNTITCVGNCDEDCECNSKIDLVSSNKTPIIKLFKDGENYFCYYDDDNDATTENRYALLSSRMFFPKDYLTQKSNYYKTYNFLLKNGEISQYTITSDLIKKMVNNYDNGKIIKVEDRNLYMLLELRPIIEIKLKAKDLNDNEKEIDTNSTTRTAKISNGNGNNATITIGAGSEFNESTSILSYKGLENKLTFSFDEKRYEGVECYINGSLTADTSYNFAENKTISIKFVPKPLEINIVYKDTTGNVVSREAMNSYINAETLPTTPGKYYINNSFFYSVTAEHSDYDLSVTINGNYIGSTKGSDGRKIECSYIIKDPDFDYEKLEIEVKIIEKDNQNINIRFELKDSSQSELSDIYGSITVEDNYNLLASGTNLTKTDYLSFNVYQERTVTVEFDLHLGYYAVEYRQNANESVSLSGLGNKFVMIQSFDPNVHYGDWYIVIEKYKFDVELDTTNKIGEYTINGREYLSDMYVGKTIDFGVEEKDGERFEYFYYLDKANNEVPIVEYNTDGITPKLDENGNKIPLNSIQITNDMLTKVFGNDIGDKINFGVKTIVQYKLDYIVSGEEYAENIEIKLGEDEYLSGTYVDVGTVLSLNITTIVPTKYNIEIKDIILNTTENVDELARTLTLNKNENLQIKIYPKTYTSTIEENVYETLEQIGNKTPVEVTTNKVNNSENKALYDQNAIITIVRVASDRELAELFVTDEKGTYVIIFDGREYKVYNVVSGVVDYSTEINLAERENPYVLSVNNNTISLQFVTKDALSIVANYKLYKSISTS